MFSIQKGACCPSGRSKARPFTPLFARSFKPGNAIPVRRRRGKVASRAGSASKASMVQKAITPRATDPRRAIDIKRGPSAVLPKNHRPSVRRGPVVCFLFKKGPAAPLGGQKPAHSPRFLPDPLSRGTPYQSEDAGERLPVAQAAPARPAWCKRP